MTAMLSPDVVPDFDGQQRCRQPGIDSDWFFRDDDLAVRTALALCMDCPLREACLAYARRHAVEGIWGGTTEDERREWRQDRKILAARITADERPTWLQVVDGYAGHTPPRILADQLALSPGTVYTMWSRHRDRLPTRAELGYRPPPNSDQCGTPAGYRDHYRRGEPPCGPCLDGLAADRRIRREKP